jgi:hypothetical protein
VTLVWKPVISDGKVDQYAIRSECGRYSVAKYGSESGVYTFAAWRTAKHELGRLMLADGFSYAVTAKLRCESDDTR